jgi:hypothetical protein
MRVALAVTLLFLWKPVSEEFSLRKMIAGQKNVWIFLRLFIILVTSYTGSFSETASTRKGTSRPKIVIPIPNETIKTKTENTPDGTWFPPGIIKV